MIAKDFKRRIAEIEEITYRFLPSQNEFIFSPEMFSCIAGGFASGKSRAGCVKGLILSVVYPGNRGIIGRYHATDLEDTTKASFFEVCPPSWIKNYAKKTNIVTLFNNSQIIFRHIHDDKAKGATKTRRLGANLGWFFLDQMEEMEEAHWNAMISRLRLPLAKRRFGFGAINPAGHDWNFRLFFPSAQEFGEDGKVDGKFYQAIRPGRNILGIVVNSEENRVSNGGFVDDSFFDSLLSLYGKDWVERYVRCSFRDFSGKIYKEYEAGLADERFASVHNIDPFDLTQYPHWDCVVGIDVGGDSNWSIVPNYVDDWGNTIVTPTFSRNTVLISDIAQWIKANTPWNDRRTTFIIDPENKVAMLELAQYGIHCQIARKDVLPGILRVGGYMHVRKGVPLPPWYYATQPKEAVRKFEPFGSPRTFVFKTATVYRKEHDTYVWDEKKVNTPKKTNTERWDTCDGDRYVKMHLPDVAKLPIPDKYAKLRARDPGSAKEWEALDRRLAHREQMRMNGALQEAFAESVEEPYPAQYEFDM